MIVLWKITLLQKDPLGKFQKIPLIGCHYKKHTYCPYSLGKEIHPTGLSCAHTDRKRKGKRKFSLMLSVYYWPQRSWGKVMFLHLSAILFTGGSVSVHAGIPPPWGPDTPPGPGFPRDQAPPQDQAPPGTRHPRGSDTPHRDQAPPQEQTPHPLRSPCWEIQPTSGRYASYWNAILSLMLSVCSLIFLLFCCRFRFV